MPEKATLERAKKDKREGKAPSTQAREFVREEIARKAAKTRGAAKRSAAARKAARTRARAGS